MDNDQDFQSLIPWNLEFDEYYENYSEKPQEKVKVGNEEGYLCIGCKDFFPYAELKANDKIFKCWSCKNGFSINA